MLVASEFGFSVCALVRLRKRYSSFRQLSLTHAVEDLTWPGPPGLCIDSHWKCLCPEDHMCRYPTGLEVIGDPLRPEILGTDLVLLNNIALDEVTAEGDLK